MREKVVTIDRLAFGGEGVGRSEGKVVFVPWTAPGDRVRLRILSDHGRFERAEAIEVVERSPDRVEPLCKVFGLCGGCQWQHLSYEAQLRAKEEVLRETLRRVGRVALPPLLPILPSPDPWHYRRRIQLQVDEEGQIGFYAPRSHRLVPIEECPIAHPLLNDKLREIRAAATRPRRAFELSLNGKGEGVEGEGVGEGVTTHERGDPGRVFQQANVEQNQKVVQGVLDFVFGKAEPAFTRKKVVVDLYAGMGNLTFPMAERAGGVLAVEENDQAVRQGQEATVVREIGNVEWIQGAAEWGLKKIYRRRLKVDTVVLDPPRRGASEVVDLLFLLRPRSLVYVSCDPTTLARDVALLTRRYYRLEKVQPIDMFPQTYHIESVAQLTLL